MFTTTTKLDTSCHKQARPTALLSVGDNIMPLSWHMPVSKSPFRYAVSVRDENISYDILHKSRSFALNFLDFSYMEAFDKSAQQHGGDKFALTNLSRKKADTIDASLIEEAYMIYECQIIDIVNYGDHDVFIADVTCIHNKETRNVSPVLFLGNGFYDTLTKQPKRRER